MSDVSVEEGARRFYTNHLNWLEQKQNDGTDPPLVGDNGEPNSDVNWDPANDSFIGIDVSDAVWGVWRIGMPDDGTLGDFRFWAVWNGKEDWDLIPASADKLKGLQELFSSDEIKLQGMDYIYCERVDGNGGNWTFEIGERK